MYQVTKRFEFCAAHRLLGHEGRCRYLHGHNYAVEVNIGSPILDPMGMVVDFSVLKVVVGGWIYDHWDHNTILHPEDPLLRVDSVEERVGRTPFIMPAGHPNPTAENMAWVLYHHVLVPAKEFNGCELWVRLFETPDSWADICQ